MSSPLPPELKLHSDPVLGVRQVSLSRFVIDPDHDITLLAAMIDRDSRTAIFKALFYLTAPKFTDKRLTFLLVVRVMEQLPDIQNPGMIVKGYIKPGNIESIILLKQLEQTNEITAAILLEGPASLPRHIQTNAHARVAVIEDGDTAEVQTVSVAMSPLLHGSPGRTFHMKKRHKVPGFLLFTAYCKPIEENHIFRDSVFHNLSTPLV